MTSNTRSASKRRRVEASTSTAGACHVGAGGRSDGTGGSCHSAPGSSSSSGRNGRKRSSVQTSYSDASNATTSDSSSRDKRRRRSDGDVHHAAADNVGNREIFNTQQQQHHEGNDESNTPIQIRSEVAIATPSTAISILTAAATTRTTTASTTATPDVLVANPISSVENSLVQPPPSSISTTEQAHDIVFAATATAAADDDCDDEVEEEEEEGKAIVSISETELRDWLSPCCVCLEKCVVDPVCMPCCSNAMCQHCLATWVCENGGLVRCPLCNVESLFPCLPSVDRIRRDLFKQRFPVKYTQREDKLVQATQHAVNTRQRIYMRNRRYMLIIRNAAVAGGGGGDEVPLLDGRDGAAPLAGVGGIGGGRLRETIMGQRANGFAATTVKRYRRNLFTIFTIAFFVAGLLFAPDEKYEGFGFEFEADNEASSVQRQSHHRRAAWSRGTLLFDKWNETDVEQWLASQQWQSKWHTQSALTNVTAWDLQVNGFGTGERLAKLTVTDLHFVQDSTAKVALLSAVQTVRDKEEAAAQALSPIYLWHFRSRRKVAAALFSTFFSVAPRTTLSICYFVGGPFPFRLVDDNYYYLGIVEQLLLWLLPQMHVLNLVLHFAAQLPVVVMVQVACLLVSVESDLVLISHMAVVYWVEGLSLWTAVRRSYSHASAHADAIKLSALMIAHSLLSDRFASVVVLSLQIQAHTDFMTVPLMTAMILQARLTPDNLFNIMLNNYF